jgi:hypothetical protein
MKMITFGPVAANTAIVASRLRITLAALGEPAKLVVVYAPIGVDFPGLLKQVTATANAPLVGATTGGAAFTELGVTETGIVGAVLAGEDLDVKVALARGLRSELTRAVAIAVKGLQPAHRRVSPLVLVDAFACDGETLIGVLGKTTPLHWRCFGGFAGDCQTSTGTKVFFNDQAYDDAAVFAIISTNVPARMAVRHGFRVEKGAKEYTVTGAAGNVIQTLDGRPATEVYGEELQKRGLQLRDDRSPVSARLRMLVTHPLAVDTPFGEGLKVRAPLGLGPDGSISLGAGIPVGSVLRVAFADSNAILDAATQLAADTIKQEGSGAVRAHFVIDCAIRRNILADRYGEQVSAFLGRSKHPMLGFCSYGEIARYGSSIHGFHNATAVSAVW